MPRLFVYGVPLSADDARWLVGQLRGDGSEDALAAAHVLEVGVGRGLYAVASRRCSGTRCSAC